MTTRTRRSTTRHGCISAVVLLGGHLVACGDATSNGAVSASSSGAGGATTSAAGGGGSGGSTGLDCDEVLPAAEAYKAAHSGNGGKDWDIIAKTPAEIAADPAAQALMALCGSDERPIIPLLAWEYGGFDHSWINPTASAFFYCVYVPVNPSTEHWQYDVVADHVAADVYVGCPEQNPCKDQQGADQVMACLGDPSNIEIMVDTASLHDGADAGLSLSEASTDLYLLMAGGMKVHLYTGL